MGVFQFERAKVRIFRELKKKIDSPTWNLRNPDTRGGKGGGGKQFRCQQVPARPEEGGEGGEHLGAAEVGYDIEKHDFRLKNPRIVIVK